MFGNHINFVIEVKVNPKVSFYLLICFLPFSFLLLTPILSPTPLQPKDTNTFPSASLAKTVKAWQLGSAQVYTTKFWGDKIIFLNFCFVCSPTSPWRVTRRGLPVWVIIKGVTSLTLSQVPPSLSCFSFFSYFFCYSSCNFN